MTHSSRRLIALVGLLILPFLAVKFSRSTEGPSGGVPAYRVWGHSEAKAAIVEFSDFQCPACAHAQSHVKRMKKAYEGRIKIVFRHYPLSRHKWAMQAAQAAECAGRQGNFWDFHDLLFDNQKKWSQADDPTLFFNEYAANLNLNAETFSLCLEDPSAQALIEADVAEGRSINVSATPTFFIGERRLTGSAFGQMAPKAIEWELKK